MKILQSKEVRKSISMHIAQQQALKEKLEAAGISGSEDSSYVSLDSEDEGAEEGEVE